MLTYLSAYLKEYFADRKDIDKFEQYINDQMAAYEESEQRVTSFYIRFIVSFWVCVQRREDKQKRAGEADEDGFMTVVSKKPKVFEGEDGGLESVPQALPIKILPNFYQHTKRTKEERATRTKNYKNLQ